MKKLLLLSVLCAIVAATNAQYKKASFLNKKGRTYDLGTTARLFGGGNSGDVGFYFSYGKERNTKRLFHWFDLEVALGHKYSYNTTAYVTYGSATPSAIVVNGKTDLSLAYRYNLAYYILDNGNDENKILPFVDASVGIVFPIKGSINFTTTPSTTATPTKTVTNIGGAYTASIGAGAVYKVNSTLGIKINALYNGVLSREGRDDYNNNYFITLPSYISVSLGVRWLLDRDND